MNHLPYNKLISTFNLTREEWLNVRKQGIGGSDAGAILGFNKYTSPHSVWVDKTTDFTKDMSDNEKVYWGNVLEPIVAAEFKNRTGKRVKKVNAILQSKKYPFMFANLDRMIVGENAILECKTANQYLANDWDGEDIPASYICQCQHYMTVTGAEICYIACLIGGQKFVFKAINRDEEFIKHLIIKEKEFWENNVIKNEPPAITGMECDSEYIKHIYQEDNGGSVMLTSDISAFVNDYMDLCIREKHISSEKEQCANIIKNFMGDAQTAASDSFNVKWSTVTSNRLDIKTLKAEYPDIYEKYIKSGQTRKFTVRKVD